MKPSLYFGSNNVASCVLQAHQAQNFSELIDALSSCPQLGITREEFHASVKKQQGEIKRRLPYLTACTFPASPWEGGRTKANARACNLIFLDVDEHQEAEKLWQSIKDARGALSPYKFAIYKTASFTAGKPRLRIMVDAQGISPEKYPQAAQTIAAHFDITKIDQCSETCCQPMFVPFIFQGEDPDLEYAFIHHNREGRAFTEDDIQAGLPAAASPSPRQAQSSAESDGLEYLRPTVAGYDTPEALAPVLACLNADMGRADWLKVAAGIKHQVGEDGFYAFDRWSAKSPHKYDPEATRKLWDSLGRQTHDRAPVTFQTVLSMAKQAGYVDPQRTLLNPAHAVKCEGMRPLPRICCAADLIENEKKNPRPQVLVSSLLHIGEKLLLAGASKSYKSWTLLDLAVSVGTGSPFWGFSTTQGRVLVLNYEIREYFFAERLEKVQKAKGCGSLKSVDVWSLRGHRAGFDRVLTELRERLMTTEYALIIIDPLYSGLAGRSENDAAEMAAFMNSIEELTECGPAVALGHHFAKGNSAMRDSLDRASGSGVFARDPDGIVTLNRHQSPSAFVAEFTLRNFAPVDRIGLRLDFPLLVPDESLNVDMLKGAQVRKASTTTAEDIVSLLPAAEGMKAAQLESAAGRVLHLGRSKFYTLLKEAKDRDLIQNTKGVYTRNQAAMASLAPEIGL